MTFFTKINNNVWLTAIWFRETVDMLLWEAWRNRLLWSTVVLGVVGWLAFWYFETADQIKATTMGGLVLLWGYVATHTFETSRKKIEKKTDIFLDLMEGLRFFILERSIMGRPEQRILLNQFQDAYHRFSLVVSPRGYRSLRKMMTALAEYLPVAHTPEDANTKQKLESFNKARKSFINCLRKEIAIQGKIDFEVFDFNLPEVLPEERT